MSQSQNKPSVFSYNGNIHQSNKTIFSIDNRAFRYGDGLFESIRVINGRMPMYDLHYDRFMAGCELLKMELPDHFSKENLLEEVNELLIANDTTENARIRLSIFRTAGGYYLPEFNKAEYTIESRQMTESHFSLNEDGFEIDLYTDFEKPTGRFSTLKTCNALIYVLAAIRRSEHKLDDCLLINFKSRIIESIDSNVFLCKGTKIITPPLTEGCIAGVMRGWVINQLRNSDTYSILEESIDIEDLFSTESIFLTNAIKGIRWVEKYKSKTYTKSPAAQWLSDELDRISVTLS
ncbi:MAG: aminotransferase class IV [Bacteroidota bacterium]|nr:aminotransferase class IV [Bacteroidota bacterium]